jgi:hypothetical protein
MLVRNAFISDTPGILTIVMFSVSMFLLISLFVTGALLSGDKESPKFILILHDIATYATPVTAGISFFLLFSH